MKIMIASDIHGAASRCRQMLDAFQRENAEKLLLLGDLLYHGPRNDLPEEYNPKEVIAILNEAKESLLCVRGNCEAEVDQMVLQFPVMADYCLLYADSHIIFATHGHLFQDENFPPLSNGDIFLYGHTHVPACHKQGEILCLNPGSIGIPKEGSLPGYLIMENSQVMWKALDGSPQVMPGLPSVMNLS